MSLFFSQKDIHSLGVLLYCMNNPGMTFEEFKPFRDGNFFPSRFISKKMRTLLKSMISTDPRQRPEAQDVVKVCDDVILTLKIRLPKPRNPSMIGAEIDAMGFSKNPNVPAP